MGDQATIAYGDRPAVDAGRVRPQFRLVNRQLASNAAYGPAAAGCVVVLQDAASDQHVVVDCQDRSAADAVAIVERVGRFGRGVRAELGVDEDQPPTAGGQHGPAPIGDAAGENHVGEAHHLIGVDREQARRRQAVQRDLPRVRGVADGPFDVQIVGDAEFRTQLDRSGRSERRRVKRDPVAIGLAGSRIAERRIRVGRGDCFPKRQQPITGVDDIGVGRHQIRSEHHARFQFRGVTDADLPRAMRPGPAGVPTGLPNRAATPAGQNAGHQTLRSVIVRSHNRWPWGSMSVGNRPLPRAEPTPFPLHTRWTGQSVQ